VRRSLKEDRAALVTALRSHVDHSVPVADHIEVVLNHDHRVPGVDNAVDDLQEVDDVGHVQPRGVVNFSITPS